MIPFHEYGTCYLQYSQWLILLTSVTPPKGVYEQSNTDVFGIYKGEEERLDVKIEIKFMANLATKEQLLRHVNTHNPAAIQGPSGQMGCF